MDLKQIVEDSRDIGIVCRNNKEVIAIIELLKKYKDCEYDYYKCDKSRVFFPYSTHISTVDFALSSDYILVEAKNYINKIYELW